MKLLFIALLSLISLVAALPIHKLSKRISGHATFFDVGLGACGQVNVASDFIVALNAAQFDVGGGYPGPMCFKGLTIHAFGKSAHATVMDRCPSEGCAYGSLDMSRELFKFFASEDVGRFDMEWEFDGDAPSTPTTQQAPPPEPTTSTPPPPPPPPPTTTSTPPPAPTPEPATTSTPPPPSTTSAPPTTTSSVAPASSSSSLSSASAAQETPDAGVGIFDAGVNGANESPANNLETINQLVMVYGNMAALAAGL